MQSQFSVLIESLRRRFYRWAACSRAWLCCWVTVKNNISYSFRCVLAQPLGPDGEPHDCAHTLGLVAGQTGRRLRRLRTATCGLVSGGLVMGGSRQKGQTDITRSAYYCEMNQNLQPHTVFVTPAWLLLCCQKQTSLLSITTCWGTRRSMSS
jgi:hypothetical protein